MRLKNITRKIYANTTAEQDVAFAMGRDAKNLLCMGNTIWLQTNPDFKFDYFPIPPKDKNIPAKAYTYMDGAYGLNNTSKNKDTALKVLNYTGTKIYGELFSSTTGEITALKGVTMPVSKPILVKCYDKMVNIAATNRYWVGSPFDAGTPSVYNILQEDMQSMYLDQMTPEALAKRLQDGISTWYPAFKK